MYTNNGGIGRSREGTLNGEYGLTDISTGLPLSKIAVENGNHLVGVEITCHTDGHIVRHIPLIKVVLDIGDGRILQVFLCTDSGLRTIGVCRGEHLTQCTEHLVVVVSEVDVILLIDGLQLGVETTNHHVLEAVALNLSPVLDLVGGDVLRVASNIVGGEGIGSTGTDGSHQFVVLVGNKVLGSHLRDTIHLVVGLLAGSRIGQLTIGLVALFYLLKQRSLGIDIVCTKRLSTFKHQVLQIVSQSRCLSRVIFRTCAHGNVGLNTGLLGIHGEVNLQAVVQRINAGLCQITRNSLVLIILGLCPHSKEHQTGREQKFNLHNLFRDLILI